MSEQQEQTSEFGQELERLFSEFAQAMQEGNWAKASTCMNALWVMFQIMSTAATTELKELTYLKTPFNFDGGGQYLMMLIHVNGPKIKLKEDKGTAYTKPFEEIK